MKTTPLLLIGILAALALAIGAAPLARAQVWLDANQLGDGKLPDWVNAKYYHQPAPPPSQQPSPQCDPLPPGYHRIWVEPVYRTICKRVWHEPLYTTVCDRIWVDGHYETHSITTYDPCGCPI